MLNKKKSIHAMHNLSYAELSKHDSCTRRQDTEENLKERVRIGVLALQGAFLEHCIAIHKCGAIPVEIRQKKDLENIQGLILPGGESSVMAKLLYEEALLDPLKKLCQSGIPVFATCAGLILMAKEIQNYPDQARLGLMDIVVERNAFGRQQESFIANIPIKKPLFEQDLETDFYIFPAIFIRAPQIISAKNNVRILAQKDNKIIAVQQNNMVACSFHPELSHDLLFHTWLVNTAKKV